MATIVMQRDLVVLLKKETILNIRLLSQVHPMPGELSRLVLKDNALEKPTQSLFNNLSYYLVSLIDSQVHASLPWPLYDTTTERKYRNELYSFISEYSALGLLTPIMCSYLVNPSCFKVTLLVHQLSQLAVNRLLTSMMVKYSKKDLYNTMAERYKSQDKDSFVERIEKETVVMLSKFSNYLCKRQIMEQISLLVRKKITEIENTLSTTNAQGYINNWVDKFTEEYEIDESFKGELVGIKNVSVQPSFFNDWLLEADKKLEHLENNWDSKVSPLLSKCMNVLELTEIIIHRNTGQVEKSSYTIEYNPKTDEISTTDLQYQVNSEQKYILRNLEKDGILNFPNLIRAFVIAVCFIMKNIEISNDIYKFNEYLNGAKRKFGDLVSALKILLERVFNAEAILQPAPVVYHQSLSFTNYVDIPPIPDLSDLKTNKEYCQLLFETFTPLNLTRHQFNLRRRTRGAFVKPQPKTLVTTFLQGPKDDFLKSLISCRVSSYDTNTSQNSHNMSIISNIKANETIAECSSGFTKQQIIRLLSTKKSSSSKKFKYQQERPDSKIKKGGLFNESVASNESNGLFRCYSSPNLFENREKRSLSNIRGRKLSIMQEASPPQFEVSGIACLDPDSNCSSPHGFGNAECSRKLDTSNFPILVKNEAVNKINDVLNNVKVDLTNEMDSIVSPILEVSRKSMVDTQSSKTETPKNNSTLIKKTSSLEKIINRFKKVRASVMPLKDDDIPTIDEEKEKVHFGVNTNRILLPDLLSPSCAVVKSNIDINDLDQLCLDMDRVERRPRESLGTVLGVDQTFLDQFDLID